MQLWNDILLLNWEGEVVFWWKGTKDLLRGTEIENTFLSTNNKDIYQFYDTIAHLFNIQISELWARDRECFSQTPSALWMTSKTDTELSITRLSPAVDQAHTSFMWVRRGFGKKEPSSVELSWNSLKLEMGSKHMHIKTHSQVMSGEHSRKQVQRTWGNVLSFLTVFVFLSFISCRIFGNT